MAQSNPYEATQSPSTMTSGGLKFRLSVMMFLEFFIWGAWLPLSFGYFGATGLAFSEDHYTLITLAFPIAAIIAMFAINQFVDRNFAAQRYLAASQFIGGIAMVIFGYMCREHFRTPNTGSADKDFWIYFALMAVHCICYVPTFAVTNTIAFANLRDPQKDFGPIRLWGTIGWIAASWPFIFILANWNEVPSIGEVGFVTWLGEALGNPLKGVALNEGISWTFIVSGAASVILAGFSLLLPHTPPKPAKKAEDRFAIVEVVKLLRHPFILVLFIVTFIDAMVHDGYFFFAGEYLKKIGVASNWVTPAMTVGQIAEIAAMAVLGYALKRLGWRATMIIGVLGHTARFAVFALMANDSFANIAPYVAVAVNLVHGICYAFFFATVYIFVDEFFPKDARTSAQGLFNFLIFGMGPIAARILWPKLQAQYATAAGDVIYSKLLYIPSLIALAGAVMLLLFFHPPKKATDLQH